MLEIVGYLAVIYLFAFLSGIGLSLLLVPNFLKRGLWYLALAPGFGLLQLSIVSGALIVISAAIAFAAPIAAMLGIAGAVGSAYIYWTKLRRASPTLSLRNALVYLTEALTRNLESFRQGLISWQALAVASVLLVVLAPVLKANMATMPYRIGIDQVGYATTAQYLVEGGTFKQLQADLLTKLQTKDLQKAKIQNSKLVPFQLYVQSEFILKALRWGFPGTVAALTLLTHSEHVYRIQFIMLIISDGLLYFLAMHVLRNFFSLTATAAYAFAAGILLNCNLLNVYYEGQLAQVFTTPYVFLLFILFAHARRLPDDPTRINLTSPDFMKTTLCFGFLIAGLFCSYNEAIVLVIGLIYFTFIADFFMRGRSTRTGMIFALIALGLGFVAVPFISAQWAYYTVANLSGLGKAGFWQPHWGSFAEVLGYLNMYTQTGYVLYKRSSSDALLNNMLSAVLTLVTAWFILTAKRVDRAFWIAAPILTLAAYLKFFYIDGILNYAYMKVYTLLLPLSGCITAAAIYYACGKLPKRFQPVHLAAATVIIGTGITYVAQYVQDDKTKFVTADMFALYRSEAAHRLADAAILTNGSQIRKFMLTPLITFNWINEDDSEKLIAPYIDTPVDVVLDNADFTCKDCFIRKFQPHIQTINSSYLIYRTGLTVKKLCNTSAAKYTLDLLGESDNRQQWNSLPSPECDFQYVHSLPFLVQDKS